MTPDQLDTTLNRVLTEAERASIAAARQAYERGEIQQREVGPGIYKLERVS